MYPTKKKWYEKREPKPPKELRRGWTLCVRECIDFSPDGGLYSYDEYIVLHKNHTIHMPLSVHVVATDLTKPEAEALKKLY